MVVDRKPCGRCRVRLIGGLPRIIISRSMRTRVLLALCLSATFGRANGIAQWMQAGPPGGHVSTGGLVSDPKFPTVLYFADRFTGVWRSRDGGTTWLPANNGLIAPVGRLVFDPSSRAT